MAVDAPKGRFRRGRLFWLGTIAITLPCLVLLGINLALATAPARNWAAAKISQRIGHETRIGRISIWPWNGITLHQLHISQHTKLSSGIHEALVQAVAIRIHPDWSQIPHKKIIPREIEMDHPRIVIPIELLASLMPASPPVAAGPPVAMQQAPSTSGTAETPGKQGITPTPPPTAAKSPAPVPPNLPPTIWLHLKNASFKITSTRTSPEGLEISGINGSIPIGGQSARSSLQIQKLSIGDHELIKDFKPSLDWKFPMLTLNPLEMQVAGIRTNVVARAILAGPIPLEMHVLCPAQELTPLTLAAQARVQAKQIAAKADFRGFLLQPSSWNGAFLSEAKNVTVNFQQHNTLFFQGRCLIAMRGGQLISPNFKLIGEEVSILGNASALSDGRWAAALRLVADPDQAQTAAQKFFPNIPITLTPLSTPQRAAFDLTAAGNLDQLNLQIGHNGPIIRSNHGAPHP